MTKTDNALDVVAKHLPDAPIPYMVGVGAVALQMALQYWNINTVQDGVLYQQYKMEGKNLGGLHLDQVFETAIRMEQHLMQTNERVADMVIQTLEIGMDNEASVKKMIYDFINEDVPTHPEPAVVTKHYLNLNIEDPFEKGFKALELSLGLEDYELGLYTGIINEMSAEDKNKLIDKVLFCKTFDEFQVIIDNVMNKFEEELPSLDSVYSLFNTSVTNAIWTPSDPEAKSFLLDSFIEVAGIAYGERPIFDKALSYFNVDEFHNNLKEIYLQNKTSDS